MDEDVADLTVVVDVDVEDLEARTMLFGLVEEVEILEMAGIWTDKEAAEDLDVVEMLKLPGAINDVGTGPGVNMIGPRVETPAEDSADADVLAKDPSGR